MRKPWARSRSLRSSETFPGTIVGPADSEGGATKVVIPGKAIAKLERQAEHPLTDGYARKDMVNQMRRPLGHATSPAARAKASTVAGKRD